MSRVSLKSSIGKHLVEFSTFGESGDSVIDSPVVDISKYLIHTFHFNIHNSSSDLASYAEVLVSNNGEDWSSIFIAEISANSNEAFHFHDTFNFLKCKVRFSGAGNFRVLQSHNPLARIASRSSGIPDQDKLPDSSDPNCSLCDTFDCGTDECPCWCETCNCETTPPHINTSTSIEPILNSVFLSKVSSNDFPYKIYKSCSNEDSYNIDKIKVNFIDCSSNAIKFSIKNDHDFSLYIGDVLDGYKDYNIEGNNLDLITGPVPANSEMNFSIPLTSSKNISFDFYFTNAESEVIFGSRIDVPHEHAACVSGDFSIFGSVHQNWSPISDAEVLLFDSNDNFISTLTTKEDLINFYFKLNFESSDSYYIIVNKPDYISLKSKLFSINTAGESYYLDLPSLQPASDSNTSYSCSQFSKNYYGEEFFENPPLEPEFNSEINKDCPFDFQIVSYDLIDSNQTIVESNSDNKIVENKLTSFNYNVCYICPNNNLTNISTDYNGCLARNDLLISSHDAESSTGYKLTFLNKEGFTACCDSIYAEDETVDITASISEGYEFDRWFGSDIADPNSLSTSITMTENKYIYPICNKIKDQFFLSVLFTKGGSSSGSGQYESGSKVNISATPDEGFSFVRWYVIEDIHDLSLSIQSTANQNLEDKITQYLSEKDYLIENPNAENTTVTIESNLTIVAKFVSNASQAAAAGDEYFSQLSSEEINQLKASQEFDQVGEVVYVDLEGGFYGITVGESKYFPVNIQEELAGYYEGPGLTNIDFTGYSDPEYTSFIMWGKPAFIEDYEIIIVDPEPILTSSTEAEIIIDDPTSTTEAPDIIEEYNSTYGSTYKFVRFSNGLKVLLDPWHIDPLNNYNEFVDMFGTVTEPKCQQVSFNGHYPLYKWGSCAQENSAPGTYPESYVLDGKYGGELWYSYPGGTTLYYGDWPHYPEDDSTTTTTTIE